MLHSTDAATQARVRSELTASGKTMVSTPSWDVYISKRPNKDGLEVAVTKTGHTEDQADFLDGAVDSVWITKGAVLVVNHVDGSVVVTGDALTQVDIPRGERVTHFVKNFVDEPPRIVTNKGWRTAPSYDL